MSNRRGHGTLAAALRRIGREPAVDSLTSILLVGGLSGSSVHQLEVAGEIMVLKITTPSEDGQPMARARREVWFYRDLAARVPILVPRVLGLDLDERGGAVILLAAYTPSPLPDEWTKCSYVQIARQLGHLHATFIGREAVTTLPSWLRATPKVSIAQCRNAARTWRALSDRDDLSMVFEHYLRKTARLAMRVRTLDARMFTLPTTLCHGDCHAGNLLQGPGGEWIWADWQDVRLGPGEDDLAFFWQRAFVAADTSPPYDAMVQAYGVGLMTGDGVQITFEQLVRAITWAELRSWLVAWPNYLRFLSTEQVERVLQRVDMLIGQLELADQL